MYTYVYAGTPAQIINPSLKLSPDNKVHPKLLLPVKQKKMTKRFNDSISSKEIIEDWLKDSGTREYIQWVAEQLNCSTDDLVFLEVHPDFQEEDEEGWNIESFFPRGTEIKKTLIHFDGTLETIDLPNFSIGVVYKVEVNGKVLYADFNASPVGMIINEKDLV